MAKFGAKLRFYLLLVMLIGWLVIMYKPMRAAFGDELTIECGERCLFQEVVYAPELFYKSDCSIKSRNMLVKIKAGVDAELNRCALPTPTPTPEPTPEPTVEPTPTPTPELPADYVAARLKWQEQMVTAGKKWCLDNTVADSGAWYYDGAKVYHSIRNFTGDPYFDQCITAQHNRYSSIVDAAGGQVPGYRVFPHGFDKQNDTARLQLLVSKSTYAHLFLNCSDQWSVHHPEISREVAYMLHTLIIADRRGLQSPFFIQDVSEADHCTRIGNSHRITAKDALFFAKHHAISFVTSSDYVQSFMAGLTANALIEYYEDVEQDPEILSIVQVLADWLWNNAWYEAEQRFRYCVNRNGSLCLTADDPYSKDVQLLIAPMYAWLYAKGQGDIYAERFDKAFISAVNGASIFWNGKIFTQNYRASFEAVYFREQ